MSKAPRGRRVPPKGRGPRPAVPDDFDAIDAAAGGDATGPAAGGSAGSGAAPVRTTRSQNRAAKRAATGVRPKSVRGGQVRGRQARQTNTALILLALAAVAVGVGVFAFGNPFGGPGASPSASAGASGTSPYGNGTCPISQPAPLGATESRYVTIETEEGDIVLKIDGALSPIAAGNFVALAECEYYDGVVFHRTPTLASGAPFVLQGGDGQYGRADGDLSGVGTGGPGYTIEDEPVTAEYEVGTVAMARGQAAHSQGSQFFIVLSEETAPILVANGNNYALFGRVVSGMDVANAIFAASNGVELPTNPIAMDRVTVSETPPATAAPTTAPTAPASPAAPTGSAAPTAAPTTAP